MISLKNITVLVYGIPTDIYGLKYKRMLFNYFRSLDETVNMCFLENTLKSKKLRLYQSIFNSNFIRPRYGRHSDDGLAHLYYNRKATMPELLTRSVESLTTDYILIVTKECLFHDLYIKFLLSFLYPERPIDSFKYGWGALFLYTSLKSGPLVKTSREYKKLEILYYDNITEIDSFFSIFTSRDKPISDIGAIVIRRKYLLKMIDFGIGLDIVESMLSLNSSTAEPMLFCDSFPLKVRR